MTTRTRAELNSDADTYINDNAGGGITAADVRNRVKDLSDSALMAEDIGSDVQAHDDLLDDIAGLTLAAQAGKVIVVNATADGLELGESASTLDDIDAGTTNVHFTVTDETKLDGIEALADVTDATNVGAAISDAAPKTTPIDADRVGLIDSAASLALKYVTWENVKGTLKTYTDTLYATTSHAHTFASLETKPTTLSGYGITDAQPLDADLTAIAGLSSAADKGIQFTGAGTAGLFDLTAAGKALLDDADAAAQRTTLGLAIGSNVQAHDDFLDDIAGFTLAGQAGKVIVVNSGENGLELGESAGGGGSFVSGVFFKSDPYSVAFSKTGAATVSIKAGTSVEAAGVVYTFAAATAVTMPTHAAGTDYAIWIKPDGTLEATVNFVSPPVANSRRIGGYHYAPGGNAAAQSGGDTTPAINEYSLWDVKFRPACPDPRGMALVSNSFWVDIYLLGVDHHTNGSSKYNVTIADGSSPPKAPTLFGGNGSTAYSNLTWFVAFEVLSSHGKQLLSYGEFAAAAFGTTEAASGGTDPVSTILRAASTSKWGMMLSTGNLRTWGRDFGGPNGASSFVDQGGRGGAYELSNAVVLGGRWGDGADSGSRASSWRDLPSDSASSVGARGRCDHLNHV